jgi:hypothetical protein
MDIYTQLYRSEEPTLASDMMQWIETQLKDGELVGEPMELFQYYAGVAYEPTLKLYELCNYKGEGDDGYAVGDDALKYPVYSGR